jgi:NAD dependent epimerase/dehydratase
MSHWKNRRVLVTGAGGFIGSHLTEELARRGAKVRAMVRYNSRGHWGFLEDFEPAVMARLEVRAGDVTDAHQIAALTEGCDVVFHLAALIAIPYSYQAPASFVATNVAGTLNVLEACRRHNVEKVVHTSTSEVYGTAMYAPIDERHPLQGQSPYSASKIGADHLAESFYRSFGLPVAIARPFNTYGPRQSARAVIPTIISQLAAGTKTVRLGDTRPVRDFNYVADTVAGFLAVAESPKSAGQTFNLGSGRGVTIGETAQLALKLMGVKAHVARDKQRLRPRDSEVFKLICGNAKSGKILGWKPLYSLEEGLALTIDYIRRYPDRYKSGRYNV